MIDRFDRETVRALSVPGATRLFTGGGKGAFACDDDRAVTSLRRELIAAAHKDGIGISFGVNADYGEAAHVTDETYPWLPRTAELEGHPCAESGLYPTSTGVHRLVKQRDWQRGERLSRHFETELRQAFPLLPDDRQVEFFHDVGDESPEGRSAAMALGGRNRWAIIAMDGNDMGEQHREAGERWGASVETLSRWLGHMSGELDECTRGACQDAIRAVLDVWLKEGEESKDAAQPLVVPIRPLLVGGDDILILCHVRHAMRFVRVACQSFAKRSRQAAQRAQGDDIDLWPGTGGEISITAGVLFAPVSLPLATAIPYAESLLASAKGEGRKHPEKGQATPACVDWECVTEGLLDSPADRRWRELRFVDGDSNQLVDLTRRPYTLDRLVELEGLAERYREVPATLRHQVLPALRAGFWDRQVFLARLGKHQAELVADLKEADEPARPPGGRWCVEMENGRTTRRTDVVDALMLLEEDGRMSWVTVTGRAGV
jgi:hypothetical protein